MRICFIAAEYSPFAKTGGLGDVAAALTRDLARRGHDLRVFVPLHGQMELAGIDRHAVDFLGGLTLQVGPHEFRYDVQTARVPGTELWVYLVDCPALFDRPRVYSDAPDEHVRYLALTRAAFECCQRMAFAPQIMHSNDWHTALAPLLLRNAYAWDRSSSARRAACSPSTTSVTRAYSPRRAPRTSDPASPSRRCTRPDLAAGRINPMRLGVLHADAVTTVSPTYATEIRTPEGGHGLDGDLRARGDSVTGILNGVDYEEWNPATDRYIPHNYDASDLTGKLWNKRALLDLLRMPAAPDTPLIGMVTRLTPQKGIDLLFDVLPRTALHARPAFRRARQRRAPLRGIPARAAAAVPGSRRVLQRLQRGTRAHDRGGVRHLPHAVACTSPAA